MNKDQVFSLIRGLMKAGGAALAAHGASSAANFLNAEDVIGIVLAIAGFVMSHKWHANDPKTSSTGTSLFILALAAIGFLGCKSTLEPGGAYAPATIIYSTNTAGVISTNVTFLEQPDPAFFQVDSSFALAYAAVDAAFKFELDNRAYLWKLSPNIKHNLDAARPTVVQVVRDYGTARVAYQANPTPTGLTELEQFLSKIQALANAASAVVTNVSPSTTSTNSAAKP